MDFDGGSFANLTPDLMQTIVFQGRAAEIARPFSLISWRPSEARVPNRRSISTRKQARTQPQELTNGHSRCLHRFVGSIPTCPTCPEIWGSEIRSWNLFELALFGNLWTRGEH